MLMLGYVCFMMAAFLGGGIANGTKPGKWLITVCDLALLGLPGLCVAAIIAVWLAYAMDAGPHGFWAFALPFPFIIAYIVFVTRVAKG